MIGELHFPVQQILRSIHDKKQEVRHEKFAREKRMAVRSELRQSWFGNGEAARALHTRSNT